MANTVESQAVSSAKKSARKSGVYCDIQGVADLPPRPDNCPVCGCVMESGDKPSRSNSPSLDRILPGLGYTTQNLWWLCHDCNRRKSDLDPARAYAMWDLVWAMIKERGLPLPATRLSPRLGGCDNAETTNKEET